MTSSVTWPERITFLNSLENFTRTSLFGSFLSEVVIFKIVFFKMAIITFSWKSTAVKNTIEKFVGFLLNDHLHLK